MALNEATKQRIEQDIQQNKVMLYMKGTPQSPMCGFSAKVVELLKAQGVTPQSRDVLEDQNLREGIKAFSNWPTIPQLYINGQFVGGCDVVTELAASGELKALLEKVAA